EYDLLEYEDIFDGSHDIEGKVDELVQAAQAGIDRVQDMGGSVAAAEPGYMKQALVDSHAKRRARIESGETPIVGVNCYTQTEPSPLTADLQTAIMRADPEAEAAAIADVQAWREQRDPDAVDEALDRVRADAKTDANLMDATLHAVRAGVTVGEWAGALREVFGSARTRSSASSTASGS